MYIVIGGSQGLGQSIIQTLLDKKYKVMNISRTKCKINSSNLTDIALDLTTLDEKNISSIFEGVKNIDGIVFSQRFRTQGDKFENKNYVDEYTTTVIATSKIIETYRKYQQKREDNNIGSIILVGSSYSKSIGLDQNWSYHACKYAQEALVNYYAVHSYGKFSINLVCPATYMKEGSEEYWKYSRKSEIWKKYPVQKLATAQFIADNIINILVNSTLFNTGNKIMLDGGVSHMYHDQDI